MQIKPFLLTFLFGVIAGALVCLFVVSIKEVLLYEEQAVESDRDKFVYNYDGRRSEISLSEYDFLVSRFEFGSENVFVAPRLEILNSSYLAHIETPKAEFHIYETDETTFFDISDALKSYEENPEEAKKTQYIYDFETESYKFRFLLKSFAYEKLDVGRILIRDASGDLLIGIKD